jgi:hypothetical protein
MNSRASIIPLSAVFAVMAACGGATIPVGHDNQSVDNQNGCAVPEGCGDAAGAGADTSAPPTSCPSGTHRCCTSTGFQCIFMGAMCARLDSACENDSGSSADAGSGSACVSNGGYCEMVFATADGYYGCKPGYQPSSDSCGPGGGDCCAPEVVCALPEGCDGGSSNVITVACTLGQDPLPCTDDTTCTPYGARCDLSKPTASPTCACPSCGGTTTMTPPTCGPGLKCNNAIPDGSGVCVPQ